MSCAGTGRTGRPCRGLPVCGATRIAYNSCRNRHCPKCQGQACRDWLAARQADLLPVAYFHVVFTLPAEIAAIAFQNKAIVYAILFKAAAQTLRMIAANPRRLAPRSASSRCCTAGARPSPIIPTCIASCRAAACPSMARAGSPADPVSSCRSPSVASVSAAVSRGAARRLRCGQPQVLRRSRRLGRASRLHPPVAEVRRLAWVVYAKPPFGGPQQVLAYLGRYTHRVAIANSRLVALDDDRAAFRWRDYSSWRQDEDHEAQAHEFIRRFLLHTLPTASIASATLASSPMVIAPPGSSCAAACWPTRNRTISNRMPKAPPPPHPSHQCIAAYAAEDR